MTPRRGGYRCGSAPDGRGRRRVRRDPRFFGWRPDLLGRWSLEVAGSPSRRCASPICEARQEGLMSRQQFAFIIGVLLVWLAWSAGWVVFAAIAAGLIGLAVVTRAGRRRGPRRVRRAFPVAVEVVKAALTCRPSTRYQSLSTQRGNFRCLKHFPPPPPGQALKPPTRPGRRPFRPTGRAIADSWRIVGAA